MTAKRILAFSSSRVSNNGFLENAAPFINSFLGADPKKIAFIPFAAVSKDYLSYHLKVQEALAHLPHIIKPVLPQNALQVIEEADVIMVGGGNTFKLLHDLYFHDLIRVIQHKVNSGAPYIGWSAGSNITGLTIGTTNDMPIIEPLSFKALGFFPFQINPHYLNQVAVGFHGETRDERLAEFIQLNPGIPVLGLPEGTMLKLENGQILYKGERTGVLFKEEERKPLFDGDDLSFLNSVGA